MHASLINSPGEDEDCSTVIIVIITTGKAGGVTSNDHARAYMVARHYSIDRLAS